jgi:hypothetical protein
MVPCRVQLSFLHVLTVCIGDGARVPYRMKLLFLLISRQFRRTAWLKNEHVMGTSAVVAKWWFNQP